MEKTPVQPGAAGISRRQMIGGGIAAAAGAAIAPVSLAGANCDAVQRWDHEFDVLVVGCGVAGACAAYEAGRAGASVAILDSGGAEANASHGTIIYMGGGTALQRACGVEDSPEAMLSYLLASTGPEPDEMRIRTFVERSIADFDWLVALGVPFSSRADDASLEYSGSELSHPWRDRVRPAPRGHVPDVPGAKSKYIGGGAWIQRRLLELTLDSRTQLVPGAVGQRLVRGSDGVIEGVVALLDGRQQTFRARRGVVLATGGFARNREMVSQHAPHYLRCEPADLQWNSGWGIRAAQAVGAGVRRMGAAGSGWYFYYPQSRRQGILVNAHGQRFVPEDSYSGRVGNAIVREQQGAAYLIVDAAIVADGRGIFTPDVIAAEAANIVELERKLDIPAPALRQTMEMYNQYAAAGQDPVLHKHGDHLRPLKPPYTALNASLGHARMTFFTLGGLHTNTRSQVLDIDGQPIPCLYAAGRVSAGIPSPYYFSSGLNLGECITFGRIAGIEVAGNR